MSEANANKLLADYFINQLTDGWEAPTAARGNGYIWLIEDTRITVSTNNKGKVVACHISTVSVPELKEITFFTQKQLEETLIGIFQEELHSFWGEPDGILPGFRGEIYHVPEYYESIILYYDVDGMVETIKLEERNGTE